MGIESPVHLVFIAAVALIVLGPKRLPALARALGQGIREFRGALEEGGMTGRAPTPQARMPTPDAQAPTPMPTPMPTPDAQASTQSAPPDAQTESRG